MKNIIPLLFLALFVSCAKADNDIKKTAKHHSAQERLNSGQAASDSITKDLD